MTRAAAAAARKAKREDRERRTGGCPAPVVSIGYVEASADADRRMAAGQLQTRCASCKRYRWPDAQRACPSFTPSPQDDDQ